MILPNQLTTLRIILTPVFVTLFVSEDPMLKKISLVVYIIAAITDWYDGWLARKFNYITEWGKFLDPLADKILTSAAFLAFVYLDVLQLWMVLAIIVRDFVITGVRLLADVKNMPFSTSKLAKWKTFVQMAFIYYLLIVYTLAADPNILNYHIGLFASLMDTILIYYIMLFVTLYTVLTGIYYLLKNRKLFWRLLTNDTQKK